MIRFYLALAVYDFTHDWDDDRDDDCGCYERVCFWGWMLRWLMSDV